MDGAQVWRYVWRIGGAAVLVALWLPAVPAGAQVVAPPAPPPVAPPVEPPVVAPTPVEVPTVPTAPAPDSPARWAYCNLTMAKWLDPSCGTSPGTQPADPGNPTDPVTSTVTTTNIGALSSYAIANGGVMADSATTTLAASTHVTSTPWNTAGPHPITGLLGRIDVDASAPGTVYGLIGLPDPSTSAWYGITYEEDVGTGLRHFAFRFPGGVENETRTATVHHAGSTVLVPCVFIEDRGDHSTLYLFLWDGDNSAELVHYQDVPQRWYGTGAPLDWTWGSPLGLGPVVKSPTAIVYPSVTATYGTVGARYGTLGAYGLLFDLATTTITTTNPWAPPTVAPAPAPVTIPPTTAAPPAVDTAPTPDPAPSGVTDSSTTDTTLATRLLDGLHWLATEVVNAIHWLADELWAMFQWLATQLWAMFEWLGSLIATAFTTLYTLLGTLLGSVVSWLRLIYDVLLSFVTSFWTQLATLLQTLMTWLLTGLLNGLIRLFVPSMSLSDVVDQATHDTSLGTFDPTAIGPPEFQDPPPDSIPTEVGAITPAGTVCGPSFAIPAPVGKTFYAPTPPESGCPGNGPGGSRTYGDDQAGGVFGHRVALRAFATILLWLWFVMRMARQMPWYAALDADDGAMVMASIEGGGVDPRYMA